jgi:hypothetical protein
MFSNRILARPILQGRERVDDGHALRVRSIGRIKITPSENGNSDGAEIIRTHHNELHPIPLRARGVVPLRNDNGAQFALKWSRAAQRRRLHAGLRAQSI